MEKKYPFGVYERMMSIGIACSFFIPSILALYIYLSGVLSLILLTAFLIALAFWISSSFRVAFSDSKTIVVYLLTIVLLMIQNLEEWKNGFVRVFLSVFPNQGQIVLTPKIYLCLFFFITTSIFLAGGAAFYKNQAIGYFLAFFLYCWAVIFGLFHYLFPLFSGSGFQYMPGQYVAPLSILIGVIGLAQLSKQPDGSESLS